MAQHQRLTLKRVEDLLNRLDRYEPSLKDPLADLLRVLVRIDATLVKHEHTDIARELRRSFDRAEDRL